MWCDDALRVCARVYDSVCVFVCMCEYDCVRVERRTQTDSEVLPQYYAFRWLTTLMAREFVLPDVQRLWDSLFADEHRFQLLVFCGVAMISLSKDYLLEVRVA